MLILKTIFKGRDHNGGIERHGAYLLPQNALKIDLHVGQFSLNTYWMLTEDFIPPKLQESSPHNWTGQKGGKTKGIRDGSCALGTELWKRKGDSLQLLGNQAEQILSFRCSEESAETGLKQVGQRETSTDSPGQLIVFPSVWLLGAETWVSSDRPGERTGVGFTEIAQRAWSVVWVATRRVHRTKSGSAIEATLLTCT